MRRILALAATATALLCAAVTATCVSGAQTSSQKTGEATPAESIQNARNVVSLSLVGPVEIEADVKITSLQGKKEKETYTLEIGQRRTVSAEKSICPGTPRMSILPTTSIFR
jgi:PIN domain nuclease of toxin-antitoxin system